MVDNFFFFEIHSLQDKMAQILTTYVQPILDIFKR